MSRVVHFEQLECYDEVGTVISVMGRLMIDQLAPNSRFPWYATLSSRLGLYVGRVLYVPEAHLSLRWSIGPETHAECPLPSHSDDATTSIPRR